MPKRKEIDEKALIKMVEEGVPQSEIMEKFEFKNSSQLKVALLNALMNTGKAPKIESGRKSKAKIQTQIAVNKRGSLIIPKALVEHFGLNEGDAFEVKRTKAGLQLKRID